MGLPNAARRWIVRAIAAVVALLVAALAAAPARADRHRRYRAVGDDRRLASHKLRRRDGAAYSQPTPTAPQSNTATNTQTATATGGAGGSATGGNAGPSQAGGARREATPIANGGRAESHNSLESKQSNQVDSGVPAPAVMAGSNRTARTPSWSRAPNGGRSDRAAARTNRARSREHSESGTAGRVIRREAKERGGHETGKASPLDGGLPGHGGQLPSQNPFFSLLSGSGGAGTGLLMLLLAVLGASIALPNHRFKAFRTPAVAWRPSAYVSPIELPG